MRHRIPEMLLGGALLVLACAGCLDEDPVGDGQDGLDEEDAVTASCRAIAEATCAALESCCEAGWTAFERALCTDDYAADSCLDEVGTGVASGRIVLQPTAQAACLDEIAAFYQECPFGQLKGRFDFPSCDDLFVGQVAVAGACDADQECGAGLRCLHGQCGALPRDGQACLDATQCDEGLLCAQGTCRPKDGLGDPCEWLPYPNDSCGAGLYCAASGQCEPQVGFGEACASPSACYLGYCDQQEDEPGVCADYGEPYVFHYCDLEAYLNGE